MTIIIKDKDMELLKSYRKQVIGVKHYYKRANILNSCQIKELDYFINNILRYCKTSKRFKINVRQKAKKDYYRSIRYNEPINKNQLEHYRMIQKMLGHIRLSVYRDETFNDDECKNGLYSLFRSVNVHIGARKSEIEYRLKYE